MNYLTTDKAIEWQVRYYKAILTKGEIIADIAKDAEIIANYSTVHKYTSVLFNISERQSQLDLKAYESIAHLLNYTETAEETLRVQTVKPTYLSKIPKDTEPRIAIEALMLSNTVKEVQENLRLAEINLHETEAKLKEELAIRAEKAEQQRQQKAKEAEQKKLDRQQRLEEQRAEDEQRAELLTRWKQDNPKEYNQLRRAEQPHKLTLNGHKYLIANDLYTDLDLSETTTEDRTHYLWEDNYEGATFDSLTEDECRKIQEIDDKIRELHNQATDIFIHYV